MVWVHGSGGGVAGMSGSRGMTIGMRGLLQLSGVLCILSIIDFCLEIRSKLARAFRPSRLLKSLREGVICVTRMLRANP